jgi:hypothetical protein
MLDVVQQSPPNVILKEPQTGASTGTKHGGD